MVSSEHPLVPSCSSNSAGPCVRADPATLVANAPTCQDPRDLVQQFPEFSIRDYVFSSRSKDVKRSWPFHPNSLQLCLKHGVKNPLPPFESPDFIRLPPVITFTNVEQSAAHSKDIACVGLVKTSGAGLLDVDTSDVNFQSSQPVDINQVRSTNELDQTDGLIPVDLQDNSWTKASRQTEVTRSSWRSKNLESYCKTSQNKGKSVVKLGTQTDIWRTEGISSISSPVSEPMASKTCPVCKVFSSNSNTTLNAHIDQCLSVESNTEVVETVSVKPKVKAKKNKILSTHIDHCPFVESNTELVETVLVKPKVKAKKKRLMSDIYKTALPYTLEDLDRRNGTNWAVELAVPELNNEVCSENQSTELVPVDARDDERGGNVYFDSNGIKIRILSKCSDVPLVLSDDRGKKKVPKHETGKCILMGKKILKSKTLKNKKLKMHGKYNKMNRMNSQVEACPNINEGTTEGHMHLQNHTERTNNHGSGTMRQWECSKHSDISKNIKIKLRDKKFGKVSSGAQELARSSMLGFDSSQVPESPTGAFSSQPSEEMDTTSQLNGVEQSTNSSRLLRLPSETRIQNSLLAKVPRSAAVVANRKIREIGRREANKSDNNYTIKNSDSVKRCGARNSFSIAGPSNGPNKLACTSKKFQKQRSLLRTGRHAFPPFRSRQVYGFGQDNEPDTRHASKKFRLTGNRTLKKFVKHTEDKEDTADNNFSVGSDMPLSRQQDNRYHEPEQTKGTQDFGGEEPKNDTSCDSFCKNDPANSCNEISHGSLSPEKNIIDSDTFVESYGVGVEDPSSSDKLPHHANESNSVVNNEVDEWRVDIVSTKESSVGLTNNTNMCLGSPQDNSSITSNREDSNQERGLPFGPDSLDFPVSIALTLAPTTLKDSRTKESKPGPSSVRMVEERTTESLHKEIKSMSMVRDGEQLPNGKSFCCSSQATIFMDSQSHQQSGVAKPMLNFSRKQVPQLHIGLTASSSFSAYQRTHTEAEPFLDSHDQPLAAKVSEEYSINIPSYTTDCMNLSLQTQLPSPSNSIFRLMGKNLMVMNNEENVHPPAPSSEYIVRGNYVAPDSFVSPNYQHLDDSAFMNTAQATTNHQIPQPSVQAGNFVGLPFHNCSMMQSDYHSQEKSQQNLPAMRHPTYTMREVIVIDDSPECRSEPQVSMLHPIAPSQATFSVPNTMAPRLFYCLPSPPIETAAGSLPVFANVGSMAGVNSSGQSNQTEAANSYTPSPFFVHPQTGYINSSVYYSQNLQ